MKPSVGRIVHLVGGNGKCLAAIVTDVDPEVPPAPDGSLYSAPVVALTVFPGSVGMSPVGYDPDGTHHGMWHWPERVEG